MQVAVQQGLRDADRGQFGDDLADIPGSRLDRLVVFGAEVLGQAVRAEQAIDLRVETSQPPVHTSRFEKAPVIVGGWSEPSTPA